MRTSRTQRSVPPALLSPMLVAVLAGTVAGCGQRGDTAAPAAASPAASPAAPASPAGSAGSAAGSVGSAGGVPSSPSSGEAAGGGARAVGTTPARRYVDAVNTDDLDALVDAFAPDGKIIDVSREIRGHDRIREWARAEVMGGRLRVLGVTDRDDGQDLLVHWAPEGSEGWRAHYDFAFTGDRIAVANLQYA